MCSAGKDAAMKNREQCVILKVVGAFHAPTDWTGRYFAEFPEDVRL
jgi:hypothetical protein